MRLGNAKAGSAGAVVCLLLLAVQASSALPGCLAVLGGISGCLYGRSCCLHPSSDEPRLRRASCGALAEQSHPGWTLEDQSQSALHEDNESTSTTGGHSNEVTEDCSTDCSGECVVKLRADLEESVERLEQMLLDTRVQLHGLNDTVSRASGSASRTEARVERLSTQVNDLEWELRGVVAEIEGTASDTPPETDHTELPVADASPLSTSCSQHVGVLRNEPGDREIGSEMSFSHVTVHDSKIYAFAPNGCVCVYDGGRRVQAFQLPAPCRHFVPTGVDVGGGSVFVVDNETMSVHRFRIPENVSDTEAVLEWSTLPHDVFLQNPIELKVMLEDKISSVNSAVFVVDYDLHYAAGDMVLVLDPENGSVLDRISTPDPKKLAIDHRVPKRLIVTHTSGFNVFAAGGRYEKLQSFDLLLPFHKNVITDEMTWTKWRMLSDLGGLAVSGGHILLNDQRTTAVENKEDEFAPAQDKMHSKRVFQYLLPLPGDDQEPSAELRPTKNFTREARVDSNIAADDAGTIVTCSEKRAGVRVIAPQECA